MQARTPVFEIPSTSPRVLGPALYGAAHAVDESHLKFLDEPQEWAVFSRSMDELPAATGVWESQVLVGGMHCATCSLKVEQALLATRGIVAARVSVTT